MSGKQREEFEEAARRFREVMDELYPGPGQAQAQLAQIEAREALGTFRSASTDTGAQQDEATRKTPVPIPGALRELCALLLRVRAEFDSKGERTGQRPVTNRQIGQLAYQSSNRHSVPGRPGSQLARVPSDAHMSGVLKNWMPTESVTDVKDLVIPGPALAFHIVNGLGGSQQDALQAYDLAERARERLPRRIDEGNLQRPAAEETQAAPPAWMWGEFAPGDELNQRYRLEQRLGSGAMGSVWKAHDQFLDRTVALKELVRDHAGIEDLAKRRERARNEARALARIDHPAIVSIHDLISVGDDPWIVMGYASGRSLDKIIRDESPLDEQAVASIGLPVLQGLMACHAQGVYHRDVKPANIVVAQDSSVHLVDFGIARIVGKSPLTGDRKILGTPEYLAPELLRGEQAGPSSDLWSLGVTLYYALEGRSPFRGEDMAATIAALLSEDPPEPRRRGALASVVLQMLRRSPAERPDAATVASILRSVLTGAPQSGKRKPVRVRAPQLITPLTGMPAGDAADIVGGAATDSVVGALLTMAETEAARIISRCPHDVAGKLIGAMAADQPAPAGKILDMIAAAQAGRILDHMNPSDAASALDALPPAGAVRILSRAGTLTAVGALTEMAPRSAGQVITAMDETRAADVLGRMLPDAAAAILNLVPSDLGGRLLQRFPEGFQSLIGRYRR